MSNEVQNGQMQRQINDKIKAIQYHKEALMTAWLAETGLLPSESALCVEHNGDKMRIWVERLPNKEEDNNG